MSHSYWELGNRKKVKIQFSEGRKRKSYFFVIFFNLNYSVGIKNYIILIKK